MIHKRSTALEHKTIIDDEMFRRIGVNSELVFVSDSIDMMNGLHIDMNRVLKDSEVNSFVAIKLNKISNCSRFKLIISDQALITLK